VPPYAPDGDHHGTSAALEFAVQALKVKHIVILGHARCGGIQAFAEGAAPLSSGDFIGRWMTMIAPAAERLGPRDAHDEDYLGRLERAAIAQSLENLMTFPYVADRVRSGELLLHGAYFGVATGVLLVREGDGTFTPAPV
jgi:carbonic anhydrase